MASLAPELSWQDRASFSKQNDGTPMTSSSTEQLKQRQRRRKLPRVILAVLCILFLSSAGGIALAVTLILDPAEVQGASLSRDLILYAAVLSLLYVVLHIRAALRRTITTQMASSYMYRDGLHASALVVARLSIATWICALIATAAMISKASPLQGLASKSPILNLLICTGALPSFAIILCTIERDRMPFTTAGFSTSSLLTCRVSAFAEDLATGEGVPRRESMHRRTDGGKSTISQPMTSHPVSVAHQPWAVDNGRSQKAASPAMRQTRVRPTQMGPRPQPSRAKTTIPIQTLSPLAPLYCPGGWRTEWDYVEMPLGAGAGAAPARHGSIPNPPAGAVHTQTVATSGM